MRLVGVVVVSEAQQKTLGINGDIAPRHGSDCFESGATFIWVRSQEP